MRKNLQRVFALALTGAMMAGTVSAFAAEEATGMDSWTAFEETVELAIPVYDRGAEGVPDVSNNYWTQWIQENFGDQYNINVTFVPITRSDVMTDYALLAAAEDLPTVLMEYDYPKVAQWAADGYLTTIDLDEFAKVAPTYYQSMVDNNQLIYTALGDETYFAMAERPYYNTTYRYQTWVRMDWLREVGYDHVPETREEWVDAMTKIKEAGICEYPGGGFMIGNGSDQTQPWRTYPMDETEWAIHGDYNILPLGWEPNYKLLKSANADYNAGITNPEYYITTQEDAKANFVNGKCYSYSDYIGPVMDTLTAFYEANPDAELAIVPAGATSAEVPAWRAENPFGMIVGFSSFASEDEIKAAWMYMEWLSQEENLFTFQWGIEGENFNYDAETGLPVAVSDYDGEYKQGYNSSKDYWCIVIESKEAGTIEQVVEANTPQDLPQNFTEDIIQFYYDRVELAAQGYGPSDCQFSVPIEAQSEYLTTLQELYKEYRDNLTMCAPEEFDALYEQYAQEYLDAGYQAVIDERLEAYEAGNTTKLPIYE
ncbi:MAG: extracellular solute-binding protein [Lachnospiraceae bacterium]|nr:extracellular solute-binding protein [Lachnospiraceae bacterium]